MRRTSCASCGHYFSSTGEFDAHRTGEYGARDANRRRCLTAVEMARDGFESEAQTITDEAGRPIRPVWFRTAKREAARASFTRCPFQPYRTTIQPLSPPDRVLAPSTTTTPRNVEYGVTND